MDFGGGTVIEIPVNFTENGGLNTNYEITAVVRVKAILTSVDRNPDGSVTTLIVPPIPVVPGEFPGFPGGDVVKGVDLGLGTQDVMDFGLELYYDDTPDANNLTGGGFADGDLFLNIAAGDISTLATSLNVLETTQGSGIASTDDFDAFPGNDYLAIDTVVAIGATLINGNVSAINQDGNYILDPIDIFEFEGTGTTTTNVTPFSEVNPSDEFHIGHPIGSFDPTLGAVNVVTGADAQFQTDNSMSFFLKTGSIHGFKFKDHNADGLYDPADGDTLLPDWPIEIWADTDADGDFDDFHADTMTDDDGEYWFTDLNSGMYRVREGTVPGWTQSTLDPLDFEVKRGREYVAFAGQAMIPPNQVGQIEEIILDENNDSVPDLAFGNFEKGSIHALKFKDVNADGVYQAGVDQPLAGVEFTLSGTDGMNNPVGPIVMTSMEDDINTPEDETGLLWFTELKPGTYTLTETIPAGYMTSTHDMADPSVTVTIVSGQEYVALPGLANLPDPVVLPSMKFETTDDRLLFGNFIKGAIHGFKFEDMNADGVFDPTDGDVGWGGFEFDLLLEGNSIRTEVSDPDGFFWFTDLVPGEYTIVERPPVSTSIMSSTPTEVMLSVDSGQALVPALGDAHLALDTLQVELVLGDLLRFGNFVKGSIHGFKFMDNGDGRFDPAEGDVGGAGVEFELLLNGVVVATEVTVANG